MSATHFQPFHCARTAFGGPCVFGASRVRARRRVQWLLKRNCSITPRQLLRFYASLCVLSLGIALMFWAQGATLVMPFAWARRLAMGAALLVYSRHAADSEGIRLQPGRLTVELNTSGAHEPGRVRAGLGPRRARAWRPFADRALGPGPAHRGRALRAPRAAAPAGRRIALGVAALASRYSARHATR